MACGGKGGRAGKQLIITSQAKLAPVSTHPVYLATHLSFEEAPLPSPHLGSPEKCPFSSPSFSDSWEGVSVFFLRYQWIPALIWIRPPIPPWLLFSRSVVCDSLWPHGLDCSMPGSSVPHHLLDFAWTHVPATWLSWLVHGWVCDPYLAHSSTYLGCFKSELNSFFFFSYDSNRDDFSYTYYTQP